MAQGNRAGRCRGKTPNGLGLGAVRSEISSQERRKHGLTVAEVEQWHERFLLGAAHALRSRPRDDEALNEGPIKPLKQKAQRVGFRQRHLEGGD